MGFVEYNLVAEPAGFLSRLRERWSDDSAGRLSLNTGGGYEWIRLGSRRAAAVEATRNAIRGKSNWYPDVGSWEATHVREVVAENFELSWRVEFRSGCGGGPIIYDVRYRKTSEG